MLLTGYRLLFVFINGYMYNYENETKKEER